MEKVDVIVTEYARNLSDEDLAFVTGRFKQKLSGDMADLARVFSRDDSIDKWLSTATSGPQWFEMVEKIEKAVGQECISRFGVKEG
jgi:hypothetical protein